MSVLFRRSNFFIDFKTMLTYADSYVTKRFLDFMEYMKLDEKLFSRLIKDIQTYPDMNQRLQSKVDVNFLFGYINWDIIRTLDEADPLDLCNNLYNACLYQEFEVENENSPKIEFTTLAETIRAITKDSNTESIYIYMDYPCKYLSEKTEQFFQSNKVHIVSGDKKSFLTEHTFDSYFFEDVDDTEYIKRWHNQRSEVIIPAFPFNVEGYDITQDMEIIYSQDSLFKFPILEENPLEFLKKYNLDLALIDIPL